MDLQELAAKYPESDRFGILLGNAAVRRLEARLGTKIRPNMAALIACAVWDVWAVIESDTENPWKALDEANALDHLLARSGG